MGEKWEVGGQVEGQSGGTIMKNWRDKTLARAYRERGEERAKKRIRVYETDPFGATFFFDIPYYI